MATLQTRRWPAQAALLWHACAPPQLQSHRWAPRPSTPRDEEAEGCLALLVAGAAETGRLCVCRYRVVFVSRSIRADFDVKEALS